MKSIKRRILLGGVTVVCATAIAGPVAAPAGAAPGLPGLPPLPTLPSLEEILGPLAPQPPATERLAKSYTTLEKSLLKKYPGKVGLVVTPVGSDNGQAFGSLKTARAWSTMKVPVSLAAQRLAAYNDNSRVLVAELEDKAITVSDNDAAGDLWGVLGGGASSVAAVTAVLREGHDSVTQVRSEVDVPKSYPGHTDWALVDQSRFGAHLPCLAGGEEVVALMEHVASNQRWGLARPASSTTSAVKGGWGPVDSSTGKSVVRQLGVITTERGQMAVSMAAVPRSGSFGDGTKMLDRIGAWITRNIALFPMGRC